MSYNIIAERVTIYKEPSDKVIQEMKSALKSCGAMGEYGKLVAMYRAVVAHGGK